MSEMVKAALQGPQDTTRAFEPGSIHEAFELAKVLVASRLLPRSVATPEAAFAIIATGRELGLTAMQSLRSIHVIEGKPCLSSDLIAALVKQRGDVCSYFRLVESSDQVATYETQRRGEPAPTRMSFSMADATRAGVNGKDNWRKYPAAMLRARCITALARAVYPDLAMGLYDPDELAPDASPAPAGYIVQADVNIAAEPYRKQNALTAAPATAQDDAFAHICGLIDSAASVREVNAAAAVAGKAHKAGRIDDAQLDRIKTATVAKRAMLAIPVLPAPEGDPEEREPGSDDV